MLLRRITTHVKDQNWFAVAIDFAIVVIGVFIGIQVANWNETRAERALGDQYNVRLVADLKKDLADTEVLRDYYAVVLTSIEEADRLLSAPDPRPQSVIIAAYRASEVSAIPPNISTWEEILSSGKIGLVSDELIENGLPEYYGFQSTAGGGVAALFDSPYRQEVRSLIPLPVQLAIRADCSDVLDDLRVSRGFVSDCNLEIGDTELEAAAAGLLASPTLREHIRFQYSIVSSAQMGHLGSLEQIKQLLAAFDRIGS